MAGNRKKTFCERIRYERTRRSRQINEHDRAEVTLWKNPLPRDRGGRRRTRNHTDVPPTHRASDTRIAVSPARIAHVLHACHRNQSAERLAPSLVTKAEVGGVCWVGR
ncbi:hypothetical protein SKAU_G00013750 [Synaphobranchus kaupii]|uniref:Uncharacterized protein n=1 Tax=Synaphobranchus kaupii TaxID=118154 RepID=A0A9Q1GCB1_SYNKA|nr:hypothetical protein SKAU_G00013750 [Synaphobranchus kaupii]